MSKPRGHNNYGPYKEFVLLRQLIYETKNPSPDSKLYPEKNDYDIEKTLYTL